MYAKSPWYRELDKSSPINSLEDEVYFIKDADGNIIGEIRESNNAELVALAPKMYELLEKLSQWLPTRIIPESIYDETADILQAFTPNFNSPYNREE